MKEISGSSNRILDINLSSWTAHTFQVDETDRRMFLGGKGLGLKYLYDRLAPGVDPLGAENILAFMMGALMGTGAPCSGRFAALTKSPLTGILLSSSCGGPFGMALKTAGYDGLIISGKSGKPIYIHIDSDGAEFRDASALWGKDTRETQDDLDLSRHDGALVIGPAGENRVLFANIATGHRFLGRGGMGAVMGSKNLKAVVARGNAYKIVPRDPVTFGRVSRKATRFINVNPFTGDSYRKYGTSANVAYSNRSGILPIDNFRRGQSDQAEAVSGERMRQKYNTRPSTCQPCTILCGHRGTYADGSVHQIPEYETVGLLGTNLGIYDTDRITQWNDICGRMGMDTISAGGTLSWLMEAGEKGLLQTDLRFGSPEGVGRALEDIARRRGRGDELADGSRRLAQKYGGEAFAIHVKGLELAAYDPRGAWGQGLAYAVANRGGCHLSSTIFPLEVIFGFLNPYTARAKARFVIFFESLYAAVNSLHTCLFTTFAYVLEPPLVKFTPKPLLGFLMQHLPVVAIKLMDFRIFSKLYASVTGTRLSQWELLKIGERIHVLERWMNTREGISRKDDTLPLRFLREGRDCDPDGRTVPIEKMIDTYYRLRGYDANGIPLAETLKRLGISPHPTGSEAEIIRGSKRPSPPPKRIKKALVRLVLFVLGRALQSASKLDAAIQAEIAKWPEGFSAMFKVLPRGPRMGFIKTKEGHLAYKGAALREDAADMIIFFKNLECAFLVFTARMGTVQAFAEHRMSLKGDISLAMSLTRCLNIVQTYLYPVLIARTLIKRVPRIPLLKKLGYRLFIYAIGIPFGI
ncbi:MAG: aldehyde ferredoxin oxidoreductase family protein [Thermodesulfobacteriota bacterium]